MSRNLCARSCSLARSLALSLALAAACSRGGETPDDDPPPGAEADLAAPGDLGLPADLAPARPALLRPAWVWTLQGGLTTWGPYLAALPPGGEVGAPEVLLTFTKGYEADDLVVGMGDPGQALVQGMPADASVPLLYRLSSTGRRLAAFPLAVNLPLSSLAALPDGGVAVAGGYGDWGTDVRVGDPAADGATLTLPPCTSKLDQRLVVMVLRPGA